MTTYKSYIFLCQNTQHLYTAFFFCPHLYHLCFSLSFTVKLTTCSPQILQLSFLSHLLMDKALLLVIYSRRARGYKILGLTLSSLEFLQNTALLMLPWNISWEVSGNIFFSPLFFTSRDLRMFSLPLKSNNFTRISFRVNNSRLIFLVSSGPEDFFFGFY